MKSIIGPAIAGFFVLAGNSAQAVDWNTRYNCELQYHRAQIILVDPSHVRGSPLISHRNGTRHTVRNLGPTSESTTPCQFCNSNRNRR